MCFAKVGNIALDLMLPFASCDRPVAPFGFDGLDLLLLLRRTRSETPFLASLCFGVSK